MQGAFNMHPFFYPFLNACGHTAYALHKAVRLSMFILYFCHNQSFLKVTGFNFFSKEIIVTNRLWSNCFIKHSWQISHKNPRIWHLLTLEFLALLPFFHSQHAEGARLHGRLQAQLTSGRHLIHGGTVCFLASVVLLLTNINQGCAC